MEALWELKNVFDGLEEHLRGREYLVGEFSLADVAYAGSSFRQCELAQKGVVTLRNYPNVVSWMERIEAKESYKASV